LLNDLHPDDEKHDSILEEDGANKHDIAEINFGLLETGRWLLKVISGPNNGAEFSMQAGHSYIIGTDPNACDIVFHDTSVSRQHTRITVNPDETMVIEDLKSRNGTLVDGEPLQGKRPLAANTHVHVGTTSFVVFDREGEMQTIISPLMPAIVKTLKTEEPKSEQADVAPNAEQAQNAAAAIQVPEKPQSTNLGAFILIGILTGLFVIVGLGTITLFKGEPVAVTQNIDPSKALSNALGPFTTVKYSYNPTTGQLLLVGHVLTQADKSQLLYSLQGLNFIKSLDDSGVIIDEYVWREINQVLEKNPAWKGINVMSTTPGHFVVSGYLQTRSQADRLAEYLSANFPYPDLLENRTVVEQDVQASINALLQSTGLKSVMAKLDNGEVILTGGVPPEKIDDMAAMIAEIKEIRGVRSVRNSTSGQVAEASIVNISDKYEVTGSSNQGGKLSVVINGRILMKGDVLDGMSITLIQPNVVYLEKEGVKYKIDVNQ
jgi:type III secretion system YscD/HrpQ family protein